MEDDTPFEEWFGLWKDARPDLSPLGWYIAADLEAAFNAGVITGQESALDALIHDLREMRDKD